MQSRKKQWIRPEVTRVSLEEARQKIMAGFDLIEGDQELAKECSDLRTLITQIDDEIKRSNDHKK